MFLCYATFSPTHPIPNPFPSGGLTPREGVLIKTLTGFRTHGRADVAWRVRSKDAQSLRLSVKERAKVFTPFRFAHTSLKFALRAGSKYSLGEVRLPFQFFLCLFTTFILSAKGGQLWGDTFFRAARKRLA